MRLTFVLVIASNWGSQGQRPGPGVQGARPPLAARRAGDDGTEALVADLTELLRVRKSITDERDQLRAKADAIENERNEDVKVGGVEGGLPQLPAGYLAIVDIVDNMDPETWVRRDAALQDPDLAPDPGHDT